jgi:hypothetical protein
MGVRCSCKPLAPLPSARRASAHREDSGAQCRHTCERPGARGVPRRRSRATARCVSAGGFSECRGSSDGARSFLGRANSHSSRAMEVRLRRDHASQAIPRGRFRSRSLVSRYLSSNRSGCCRRRARRYPRYGGGLPPSNRSPGARPRRLRVRPVSDGPLTAPVPV